MEKAKQMSSWMNDNLMLPIGRKVRSAGQTHPNWIRVAAPLIACGVFVLRLAQVVALVVENAFKGLANVVRSPFVSNKCEVFKTGCQQLGNGLLLVPVVVSIYSIYLLGADTWTLLKNPENYKTVDL